METCASCHEQKDESEFGPDRRKANGLQARCYPCRRVLDRARYGGERAESLKRYSLNRYYQLQAAAHAVLGGICRVCGESDPEVLQVDHVNGDGHTEGRNRGGTKTYPRVLAEPERFQLLCANCHCRKTAADRRARGLNGAPWEGHLFQS